MVEGNNLSKLVALVADFEKLDNKILADKKTGDLDIIFNTIEATIEAKKKVKRFLGDCNYFNPDRDLGIKLKKIRDNYGYNIDRVVEAIESTMETKISQESEEDIDYVDALFSQGTADYVDDNFFRRKNQVGTLVVSESLPDHFVQHFSNLRECYALGLFQAALVYCRAVIETGCFEALRRKGLVKLDPKVKDTKEYSLNALMRDVKKFVYEPNWNRADRTIKKANEVLHSKLSSVVISEKDAFDAIQNTFAMVEEIFSGGQSNTRGRSNRPRL